MGILCNKCESDRLIVVSSKVNDCFWAKSLESGNTYDGYVPHDIGINGGNDYLKFTLCLECGQIQNWTPQTGDSITGNKKWTIEYLVDSETAYQVAVIKGDGNGVSEEEFENYIRKHHKESDLETVSIVNTWVVE